VRDPGDGTGRPFEEELTAAIGPGLSRQEPTRRRVLVAIASYGEKNLHFLKKIICDYRQMSMEVRVIVNSEAPKALDADVTNIVGLPTRNPHSLPFAHKRIFAENLDRYDLFIYSEDDIEIKEQGIQAYLRATAVVEPDEIVGHVRYEIGPDGTMFLPDVHGQFHWRPESVRRRGDYTIAEFTNEHSGFYILTRAQLQRAIESGGYLQSPYEGRHGMLETGATDPFTCCGFRKVICISAFDDFLVHHMPNRYVGLMGITRTAFLDQIQALIDIQNGHWQASRYCDAEPKFMQRTWSKSYYEAPRAELLQMVPRDSATILSIGCGWGALEDALRKRGATVTAVSLDSVIGRAAALRGIELVSGSPAECSRSLSGRVFQCVVVSNLLHLLPDPRSALREYATLVSSDGTLVITGHNFRFLPHLLKRQVGMGEYRKLRDFNEGGIHAYGMTTLSRELRRLGFRIVSRRWFDDVRPQRLPFLRHWPGSLTKRNWVIKAHRIIDAAVH
jgi:2-polyprenyl-3-methyl-5-hydroxy-6-metoxy-1,4-benzoquinol methylase